MFKIGDKVRATEFAPMGIDRSAIGVIVSKACAYDWKVDFPDDEGWRMNNEELELVTE